MTTLPPIESLSLDQLRLRLTEAEDTLRAIRDGEADAVVVRAEQDETVFALADGQDSYRAIMEAMDIGAVALDSQDRVLYANAAVCGLLDCAAAELQDRGLFALLDPASLVAVRATMAGASESRNQMQFTQPRRDGPRHLIVTATPLPLSFDIGTALTFTDVTARVAAEAARESERVGRAVLASANEAVVVCNRAGKVTNANAAAHAIAGSDPVGKCFENAFPLEFPIGSAIIRPDDLVQMANDGTSVRGIEGLVAREGQWRDLLVSVAPLRLSGEAIGGCVITLVDLTERKSIEKHQSLLMHELVHRVKNTLAMVLSISGRTIAGSRDLSDFRERFTNRIQALAATHTLLAESAWSGVSLAALVRDELAPFVSGGGPRLETSGIDGIVTPDVGIALGMVFHELATNAVKYGALSRQSGVVSVAGNHIGNDQFELVWTERGGPPVEPPARVGFGQTLITRSLNHGNGTGAKVEFAEAGLVCRIVFPVQARH